MADIFNWADDLSRQTWRQSSGDDRASFWQMDADFFVPHFGDHSATQADEKRAVDFVSPNVRVVCILLQHCAFVVLRRPRLSICLG